MFSKQTKNIKVTQLYRCKHTKWLDKALKSTKMVPSLQLNSAIMQPTENSVIC